MFLVDPSDVISYTRTDDDLELFWLFCLCVAGKTATTQARLLNAFLASLPSGDRPSSPFSRIRKALDEGVLLPLLIESRLGQFNRLYVAMSQSLAYDLRTCSVEELETIQGVGPKTARMFVMMSRENQRYAALDTHILKHLREHKIDAPVATPTGKTYRRLELAFLELADAAKMPVADYDLMIWTKYSRKENATQ